MDLKAVLVEAAQLSGQIMAWRHQIHEWPELGFEEEKTAALAAAVLESLGCRVRTGVGRTGVVAELGKGEPVVALRADMDALPIEDR
mgnify:FL=1